MVEERLLDPSVTGVGELPVDVVVPRVVVAGAHEETPNRISQLMMDQNPRP